MIDYKIEGTTFKVDVKADRLTRKDDSRYSIQFHQMKDYGDHYLLHYDRLLKGLATDQSNSHDIVPVRVPPLKVLDPDAMMYYYGVNKNQFDLYTDLQIIVDPNEIELRKKGILPIINIAGDGFEFDITKHLLTNCHFRDRQIYLRDRMVHQEKDMTGFQFIYNQKSKEVAPVPKGIEGNEMLFLVKLAPEFELDVVGYLMHYETGYNADNLLRRYPFRLIKRAEATAWSRLSIDQKDELKLMRFLTNSDSDPTEGRRLRK